MHVIAVIQARIGSTRLPGKVLYPLGGKSVLAHVIERVRTAKCISDVVVATSTKPQDDVVAQSATRFGADVVRESESNVQYRFERAVSNKNPECIVRITGDCPLIDPRTIEAIVETLITLNVDYTTNVLKRTFPRGLDVEAFTRESFKEVLSEGKEPHHREHVTPYYREHPELFSLQNVSSEEIFSEEWMHDRTDLRLTLDEPSDYEVLRRIYEHVSYEEILSIHDAVRYADENDLMRINESVRQKEV